MAEVKALEIARYILYYAYKRGDLITNLKLQKLLYYIQAWYLVRNKGVRLFSEDIEAWQYGPVVREVYDAYKCFGRNPINDEGLSDNFKLDEEIIRYIDSVLDEYMDYSASALVKSIHQDAPWQEAYKNGEIITSESMYEFYRDLLLTKEELEELANTPLSDCLKV